jgi:hypothetical protein
MSFWRTEISVSSVFHPNFTGFGTSPLTPLRKQRGELALDLLSFSVYGEGVGGRGYEWEALEGGAKNICLHTYGPVYGDFALLRGLVSKIMDLFSKALAIALNPLLLLL